VIGDLHGCLDELEHLLEDVRPGAADTVCFLGDYIDRGPTPRGVVARVLRLATEGPRCICLKGNHEDMFLAYMGYAGHYGEAFMHNGGDSTMASYGIQGLRGPAAAQRLPPDHLAFYIGLRPSVQLGRYLCVHAGVCPTRPLGEQTDEDRFWIREEFILSEHPFPVTVLFGHTPQRDVLLHLPFKVGLDTGLVYGNKLSALELTTHQLLQIGRGDKVVRRYDISADFAGLSAPAP
jgi:serine/threonine protein phosphatase 1